MDALLKELPVHQGLARVFGAVGQDGFWRALVDTLRLLVPIDNALVAVMRAGRVPRLLIDFDAKGGADEQEELADYSAGMYLLDPFYQAACAGVADGLHSLESVAPRPVPAERVLPELLPHRGGRRRVTVHDQRRWRRARFVVGTLDAIQP